MHNVNNNIDIVYYYPLKRLPSFVFVWMFPAFLFYKIFDIVAYGLYLCSTGTLRIPQKNQPLLQVFSEDPG